MQNDDENKGAGFGTPIDPADFARVRVAKLLRSEKPRKEQEDAKWNLLHQKVRMLTEHIDTVWALSPQTVSILTIGALPTGPHGFPTIVSFHHRLPKWRKAMAANFQSKFYTPPTP